MLWLFTRIRKPAKPIRTARLELITITPALLVAEQQSREAFATALQANIPAEWPPEHWEPHVFEFITKQLTDHPETTGYHRYILLPEANEKHSTSRPEPAFFADTAERHAVTPYPTAGGPLGRVPSSRVGSHETPKTNPYPRTLVGCTGSFPRPEGDVELGYSTLPTYQRRGYATEAVTALIDWLFTQKEVHSISAQTYPTLPESIKVMERCGLQPAGPGDEPSTLRYRRTR